MQGRDTQAWGRGGHGLTGTPGSPSPSPPVPSPFKGEGWARLDVPTLAGHKQPLGTGGWAAGACCFCWPARAVGCSSQALGSKWPSVLSGDCLNLRRVQMELSTGKGGPPWLTPTKRGARVSSFVPLTVPRGGTPVLQVERLRLRKAAGLGFKPRSSGTRNGVLSRHP